MTPDPTSIYLASLLATYLLHSTLFLLTAWALLPRCPSHEWKCRGWRLASVLGLATAPLQLATNLSPFALRLEGSGIAQRETPPVVEPRVMEGPAVVPTPEPSPIAGNLVPLGPVNVAPLETVQQGMPQMKGAAPIPPNGSGQQLDLERPPTFEQLTRTENARPNLPPITEVVLENAAPDEPIVESVDTGAGAGDGAEPSAEPLVEEPAERQSRTPWIVIVGGLLLGFGLLRLVVAHLRLRSWLRCGTRLQNSAARRALERLCRVHGIRCPIELLELDGLPAPAACGLLRWRILLPKGLAARTSPAAIEAFLAHELAHLVRRDGLWLWIGQFLCSTLAFQPLHFLARRRWRHSSEFLCDAWAVRSGVQPTTLARGLTDLAAVTSRTESVPTSAMAMSAVDGRSVLVERVTCLLEEPARPARWVVRSMAAVGLLLVGATPFVPAVSFRPSASIDEPAPPEAPAPGKVSPVIDVEQSVHEPSRNDVEQEWQTLDVELRALVVELNRLVQHADESPELKTLKASLEQRRAAIERRRTDIRRGLERTHSLISKESTR